MYYLDTALYISIIADKGFNVFNKFAAKFLHCRDALQRHQLKDTKPVLLKT